MNLGVILAAALAAVAIIGGVCLLVRRNRIRRDKAIAEALNRPEISAAVNYWGEEMGGRFAEALRSRLAAHFVDYGYYPNLNWDYGAEGLLFDAAQTSGSPTSFFGPLKVYMSVSPERVHVHKVRSYERTLFPVQTA